MTMIQISEGRWINPRYLAEVTLFPPVGADERYLELRAHDGGATRVDGLWIGSVMSSLELLATPYDKGR